MSTAAGGGEDGRARALRLNRSEVNRERVVAVALGLAASLTVLTTAAVVIVLARETFGFFLDPMVSVWEFLTGDRWTPLFADKHFGILPLVTGTLLVTVIAVLVGVPLGLASAVYLAEYAPPGRRRKLKGILELLAGIPTVVLGFFALSYVTPWLQGFIPGVRFFNALSAGLVMGFMILPTVSSLASDALQAVPQSLREAGYGLGGSKLDVIVRVLLPAAFSGLAAAVILAFSRAVGETMIVSLAAGQRPTLTFDPRETIATMTSFIVQAATGDQPVGSLAARSLYAVGAVLFAMTLVMNLASQALVRRFRERYE